MMKHSLPIVGDFELIRELGRGEMGIVYEARPVSLNRKVAWLREARFGTADLHGLSDGPEVPQLPLDGYLRVESERNAYRALPSAITPILSPLRTA